MLESAKKYGNLNPEKVQGILEADSEVKQLILYQLNLDNNLDLLLGYF